MPEIITDIQKLNSIATPLKFLTEQGVEKEEGTSIISQIKEVMEADKTILALSAPQIGINSRIFCIRFNDTIKTFINPIVTKKDKYDIKPESFISMPGKEILITRPEELTVVYYTEEFKYEENKLLGAAARLFDQHCQLLDGILPSELGLVSDVETDGSLADLSEDEIAQVTEIYKKFISLKTEALQKEIKENPELEKQYNSLRFTEKVINGEAAVVAGEGKEQEKAYKKAQSVAAMSLKNATQFEKQANRAQLTNFLRKKGR
jgi:peptide deformylase